ncbi:uncharacterized protein LOC136754165 [Amia ocellicauda]|uniref:uncharacterized protein LOC136754165 n=1 Tax=Amia ocellicauda TaxID=2972642 RepID=UPI003464D8F4
MWPPLTLLCVVALVLRSPHPSRSLAPAEGTLAEGRAQLQRLRGLAAQPQYGECWTRALEAVQEGCRELDEDTQSRIALAFTHCHLRRSGRPFPKCGAGRSVRECTGTMDAVAFGTYTEFFTHAHSICHYLHSELWQRRAEDTAHRLTESSAGVADQLAATQRLAEGLAEAQSVAMASQETILRNGEALKQSLQDSAMGVRQVFAQMQESAQEQRLALSEVFGRVAFLQSFVMSESHTLCSLFYNLLALGSAFLLTATQRTAGARLFLFGLVAVNVYLERLVCRAVLDNTEPGYQQSERIALLVCLLRRVMLVLGVVVLLCCAARYRDPNRESLEVLRQLRETQSSLELALQEARRLALPVDGWMVDEGKQGMGEDEMKDLGGLELSVILPPQGDPAAPVKQEPHASDTLELWAWRGVQGGSGSAGSPRRRGRPRGVTSRHGQSEQPPAALVYSVLVEPDERPRYNLRTRKSLPDPPALGGQ